MDIERTSHWEWTDDEWLRVIKEFSPTFPVAEAERAVTVWRYEREAE